jgi:DNA-directed RNA polymerase subunit RPC12/RpoP
MPEQIIYMCKDCGNYFRSSDSSLVYVEGLKCISCGRSIKSKEQEEAEKAGKCDKCGGQVKNCLIAICTKCKSSNVKVGGSVGSFS